MAEVRTPAFYHRLAQASERAAVKASGALWGKSKSNFAGGGPLMAKAYVGPLPAGQSGYTFSTEVGPTRYGMLFGMPTAEWHEGSRGVRETAPGSDYVMIEVKVVDDEA